MFIYNYAYTYVYIYKKKMETFLNKYNNSVSGLHVACENTFWMLSQTRHGHAINKKPTMWVV